MSSIGYLCAIGSAICNGSFAAVSKHPRVAERQIHPIVFNLYVCIGVAVSSLAAFPLLQYNRDFTNDPTSGTVFKFEPLGLLAGLLLVLAFTFSFLAIPHVGLSVGQGVWGGTAIIVSVAWGVFAFANKVQSIPGAVGALALLTVGVVGIAFCKEIAGAFGPEEVPEAQEVAPPSPDHSVAIDDKLRPLLDAESQEPLDAGGASASFVKGLIFAGLVGLAGGSILVPMHYVPAEGQGIVFIPSFGLGVLLASPLVTLVYFQAAGESLLEQQFHVAAVLPYGMLSGMIWNIANALSIPAIARLGYSVAYPFMQCALFVSGVWGVFVFHEIKGVAKVVFFTSGIILLAGAGVLSVSIAN